MQVLTKAQSEVLNYIIAHKFEHDEIPTIRDIQQGLGYNYPNAVRCHLDGLEKKGYISRPNIGRSRNIKIARIPSP